MSTYHDEVQLFFSTLTTYRWVFGSGWSYNMIDLATGECLAFDGGYRSQTLASAAAVRRREELLDERKRAAHGPQPEPG